MTIKEILENYIKHNLDNLNFLDSVGRDYENADKRIPPFIDKIKQTQYNSALAIDFVSLLQLSDDKAIFDQYDFEDIRNLFDSIVKLEEFNLDIYLEYAHFEWAIMDNENNARELIAIGVTKAKQKIEELERLQKSIDND